MNTTGVVRSQKSVDQNHPKCYNMGMFSKQESEMEEFKTWEEMSDLEQAQCTYWDA